jgi:hypothetical protein
MIVLAYQAFLDINGYLIKVAVFLNFLNLVTLPYFSRLFLFNFSNKNSTFYLSSFSTFFFSCQVGVDIFFYQKNFLIEKRLYLKYGKPDHGTGHGHGNQSIIPKTWTVHIF